MSLSPVTTQPLPSAPGIAEMFASANPANAESLGEEFESIFISLLLKEMRQTVDGEGLFAGDTTDSYGALFDLQLGQHLARSGGLGMHDILESYLRADQSQAETVADGDHP